MPGEWLNCRGKECEHYRKYNITQRYEGADMPSFNMFEEYCAHPKIFTQRTNFTEPLLYGVKMHNVKICPNEKSV